jgi:ABC-2 type transport system ATP-binding protein
MIEVEGLTRYYGALPAVADVGFRIEEREVVGLLGRNGAGKSTTLRLLAGLLLPSAGTVRIGGVDASDAPDSLRRRIGFLPEDPPLHREMRVRDFLAWCGELKGMSRREALARVPAVLVTCRLEDVADRVIGELSHGYRKRVGIGQAIIHAPALVILDEPISGLDPQQIVGMREVVRSLARESTVIVSSHILSEIAQTCDRIFVIDGGRLVAQGTEEELARKLGGGLRLRLELRGAAEAARAVLAATSGAVVDALHDRGEGRLEVVITLGEDRTEALVAALVGAGIGVRRVADAADELEEVFLRLTRGDAHAAAQTGGGAS